MFLYTLKLFSLDFTKLNNSSFEVQVESNSNVLVDIIGGSIQSGVSAEQVNSFRSHEKC